MRFKKIMILTIIFTCLLAVSAVNASENVSEDIASTNIVSEDIITVDADTQLIKQTSAREIIGATDDGTFTALQIKINTVEPNSKITLENDYVYDDDFNIEGINISKSLTIDGNGHSIDALKKSRIFKITANNIVLTNLTLKNGFANSGGAIYLAGGSSNNVFDCNFVNNSAEKYGGAICFNTVSSDNKFTGVFVNNSAAGGGGAISFNSHFKNNIFNASFFNNSAGCGGVIYARGDSSYNVFDGNFMNNSAREGGVFYSDTLGTFVSGNKFVGVFVNNSAGVGGAIYILMGFYNEFSGTFINNSAVRGGAIWIRGSVSNIICGIFDGNSAGFGGSAYFCDVRGDNVINNAIFRNNLAKSGSAIYFQEDIADTIIIKNSIFINNKNGTVIASVTSTNSKIDHCWFGNTAQNYNIAPNVNENVLINNWLFLNATANPIKIFSNNNSVITFSLSNLYNDSSKEIRHVELDLPDINLNISYKNGNVDKELVLLDENITYTLISDSEGSVICNYYGIGYSITIKSLDNVSLIAPDISSYYGQDKRFNIKLTENNIPLINEPINIKVNNQSYLVFTDDDGETNTTFNLDVGEYIIVSEYYDLIVSSIYTVNKANSSLIISDVNGTVNHDLILTVNVSSSNNLVNEGCVVFFDGENKIGESNVNEGVAILTYAPTSAGEHIITVIYSNDNYLSSNATSKVFVNKADSQIVFNDIGYVYINNPSKYIVNVSSNNKSINEGNLRFYINGTEVGQKTVNNGVATLDYISQNIGTFEILAIFEETNNYLYSNASCTFKVQKIPTTITASGVTTVYNGGQKIVILLKDAYGNKLDGVKVTVKFSNGAKVTADVVNGKAKVSTNGLKPVKKYTATITFNGNAKYEKSTANVKVKVYKATPKIIAKAQTFKRSDKKKQYIIRLLTNQNIKMKYTKVYIKVNGKLYAAQTNKKGYATFKLTKLTNKGKYNAKIMYGGNSYYNSLTTKVKLTVK